MTDVRPVIRIAPNNQVFDLPVIVGIEEGLFEAAGLDVKFSATHADREKDAVGGAIMARLKENMFDCGSADSYNVCEWASIDRLERGKRGGNIAALRASVAAQAILPFDDPIDHHSHIREEARVIARDSVALCKPAKVDIRNPAFSAGALPDEDPERRFKGNQARVQHVDELDAIIAAWSKRFTAEKADDILSSADIPCTLVYTAAECAADPQFRHRGMVREVDDPLFGSVLHAGVVPHVPEDPGQVRWPGPAVGAHTDEVMTELLGMRPDEIAALRTEGVL